MDKLKEKVQSIDWWEVTYLIIYGVIFAHEFLHTTMLEINWPPKIGYVFIAVSALYTTAKLIWYKSYNKKEILFSIIIILSFVMPAIVADYPYIFWVGFLIVGAKGVDFNKILKVYLVISITIMVVAFSASQYGIIEDLQYPLERGGEIFIRHSYGIAYPTDYASHVFYMALAIIVLFNEKLSAITKVWLSLLVAGSIYFTSNAQTTTLCLTGFAGLCIFERLFRNYMCQIEKVLRWTPVACAAGFLGLSYFYDFKTDWMVKIDSLLSSRLDISRRAFDNYSIKLFGQYVAEKGSGGTLEYNQYYYFFLDDSYVRILLEYGLMLFVITLIMLVLVSRNACQENQYVLVMALVTIALHSIMEHRLIDVAYNPMILALFASMAKSKQIDRRKTCIEKIVKVGSNIGTL